MVQKSIENQFRDIQNGVWPSDFENIIGNPNLLLAPSNIMFLHTPFKRPVIVEFLECHAATSDLTQLL